MYSIAVFLLYPYGYYCICVYQQSAALFLLVRHHQHLCRCNSETRHRSLFITITKGSCYSGLVLVGAYKQNGAYQQRQLL